MQQLCKFYYFYHLLIYVNIFTFSFIYLHKFLLCKTLNNKGKKIMFTYERNVFPPPVFPHPMFPSMRGNTDVNFERENLILHLLL